MGNCVLTDEQYEKAKLLSSYYFRKHKQLDYDDLVQKTLIYLWKYTDAHGECRSLESLVFKISSAVLLKRT
jgi:DNA-directed RNA polymerase specialized sigma24 family protein